MPVRWNSDFHMCRRLYEQKSVVSNYAFRKERRDLDLSDAEWTLLEELLELLGPLDELTRIFCQSSIAVQYSFAMLVKKKIDENVFQQAEINSIRSLIVECLNHRFGDLFMKW